MRTFQLTEIGLGRKATSKSFGVGEGPFYSSTKLYLFDMIVVTESAAGHLLELLNAKDFSPEEKGLRLFVEKGGCAGMSYAMQIGAANPGDEVIEKDGVKVFVDQESLEYLDGCHLDYVDALNDAGFKIENPNAARSCGCGTSFEPAKADQAPEYDPETMDGEVCGGSN